MATTDQSTINTLRELENRIENDLADASDMFHSIEDIPLDAKDPGQAYRTKINDFQRFISAINNKLEEAQKLNANREGKEKTVRASERIFR
jgi:hypothetical protein